MKGKFFITCGAYALVHALAAGCFPLVCREPRWLFLFVPLFLLVQTLPGYFSLRTKSWRLRGCYHGTVLLAVFLLSLCLSLAGHIALAVRTIPGEWETLLWSLLVSYLAHLVLFWNGILWVYLTSVQLGVKLRVVGILCGMIPVANLIALGYILVTTWREVEFETARERRNDARKQAQVCATRYPILLVHGVFFRDSRYFNYWGRIPGDLKANGAVLYYGNTQSAASVEDAAEELKRRIRQVLEESGAEKVNIIAHSKGGLDCRAALADPETAAMTASLTTVNTPHRGCMFADYLLTKVAPELADKAAAAYNRTLKHFGDPSPDFLAAVNDLTERACRERNEILSDPEGVWCQSVGSTVRRAAGGKFPLNFSYHLVRHFDGPNDGLVSDSSFAWGQRQILLTSPGKRGISHGDMIDLNRENIPGFDVREFYVNLIADLKARGL